MRIRTGTLLCVGNSDSTQRLDGALLCTVPDLSVEVSPSFGGDQSSVVVFPMDAVVLGLVTQPLHLGGEDRKEF